MMEGVHKRIQHTVKQLKKTCSTYTDALSTKLTKYKLDYPFRLFAKKRWYYIIGIDSAFILAILLLHTAISNTIAIEQASIRQAFGVAGFLLLGIAAIYTLGKWATYKILDKDVSYATILWKHVLGCICIIIPVYLLAALVFAYLLPVIFMPDALVHARTVVQYSFVIIAYFMFITFQTQDKLPFWDSMKHTTSTWWKPLPQALYATVIVSLSGYALYWLLAIVMRIYFSVIGGDIMLIADMFERLSYILIGIILAALMATNKAVVYRRYHENI